MNLKKRICAVASLLGLTFAVTACNFDSLPATGPSTNSTILAICDLSNESALVICEDYPANTSAYETSCSTTEKTQYTSVGAISDAYLVPTGSANSISCAQTNTSPLTGSCALTDRIIRYYTSAWTTTTAQTDCSSRSGQWL
jgi:hypothetical protein